MLLMNNFFVLPLLISHCLKEKGNSNSDKDILVVSGEKDVSLRELGSTKFWGSATCYFCTYHSDYGPPYENQEHS